MTAVRRRGQQVGVPVAIMRGGTSNGLYFHASDLPTPGPARDQMLLRLMGSPDVLQIDGLGGSRPITSKVAIIEPSTRHDADVDYTFAQVDIDRAAVHWNGNCGNISSGVGPFAVDEGLVSAPTGPAVVDVRIHNTNTSRILVARVPVVDGAAAVLGDCTIPGVPGAGAEIVMDWSATIGSRTGALLPTGRAVDELVLSDGRRVAATLSDVGNPAAWINAGAIGARGSELAEVNGDEQLRALVREVQARAAAAMGLCGDWTRADVDSPGLPLVGWVAEPDGYVTLNGAAVQAQDMDLRVRLMFMDRLHESLAGAASVNLAAASRVAGSVVAQVLANTDEGVLRAGHPSGVMSVSVDIVGEPTDSLTPSFSKLGMSRTARRLADAIAWVPGEGLLAAS